MTKDLESKYEELRKAIFDMTHEGDGRTIDELTNGDLAICSAVALMKMRAEQADLRALNADARVAELGKMQDVHMELHSHLEDLVSRGEGCVTSTAVWPAASPTDCGGCRWCDARKFLASLRMDVVGE